MWEPLIEHFRRYPAQERVVRLMIQGGLRIADGSICAGPIEVADTAVARAADVDRRIVRMAVEAIQGNPELMAAFGKFRPTLDLRDVAARFGGGVVEVVASDPDQPGILAAVTAVLGDARLPIRQCIVEDPAFAEEPRLTLVTASPVPRSLIPVLQAVPGVRMVVVS